MLKPTRPHYRFLLALSLLMPTTSHSTVSFTTIKNIVFGNAHNLLETLYMAGVYYLMLLPDEHKPLLSASPLLTECVNTAARERGIKKTIAVLLDPETESYMTRSHLHTIYIKPEIAQAFNELLIKKQHNELTAQEEDAYYDHLSAVHHELTHVKRNSLFWRLYVPVAFNYGAFAYLFQASFDYSRIVKTACLSALFWGLSVKYDEYKAETGMPRNKKIMEAVLKRNLAWCKILQAEIDRFEAELKADTTNDIAINFQAWLFQRKRFDKYPLLYELCLINDAHPSPFMIVPYFKKQLATFKE
jgi:hypothetical protein